MENQTKDIVKTLNNLIEVNIDRTKGYETASKETEDSDLKSLFNKYASQSVTFKTELEKMVTEKGGDAQKSSSASGTVYRAWMDTKSTLTGNSRKAILSLCEFGEDAAKNSYKKAKEDSVSYPDSVLSLISRQYEEILNGHDTIKNLRDSVVEQHH